MSDEWRELLWPNPERMYRTQPGLCGSSWETHQFESQWHARSSESHRVKGLSTEHVARWTSMKAAARDRQGAREVVELGLCCSQKGGRGREENQGEAYRKVQETPDERPTGLIRRSLEMFNHFQ